MAVEEEGVGSRSRGWGLVIVAWIAVFAPLAWGVMMTLRKASQLFGTGG